MPKKKFTFKQIEDLARKAIELWPENREAYGFLWEVALDSNDFELLKTASQKYLEIGGNDSRFYFSAFRMTNDENFLDEALKVYPAHIEAFTRKYVVMEKSGKEARFNFAVAATCVANSNILSLDKFYGQYEAYLKKFFPNRKK